MLHLFVTCAIILKNNTILAAKRGINMAHTGYWEFPGGKINTNENHEECIKREIKEELNCEIVIQEKLPDFTHNYTDKIVTLTPFICQLANNSNEPYPNEHEKITWLPINKLHSINWLEADIEIQSYISKKIRCVNSRNN